MSFRPFQDAQMTLGNLQGEMNKLFDRVWHGGFSTGPFDGQEWGPPIDLYENDESYRLFVEVPGVEAERVEVNHLENILTIRGEKPSPVQDDASRPLRGERRYGSFSRTIELPGGIDAKRLTAKCHGGVLEITIPKSEASKPKPVKVDIQPD